MNKPKYAANDIPEKVEAVIYTHYNIAGYDYGELFHYAADISGENRILIAENPVILKIPKIGDLKNKVVQALEAEKKNKEAVHYKKMFDLQEKIDSLICLEYKPQTESE